jgi:hypothetical protein
VFEGEGGLEIFLKNRIMQIKNFSILFSNIAEVNILSKGAAISTYDDKDAAWLEVVNCIKLLFP